MHNTGNNAVSSYVRVGRLTSSDNNSPRMDPDLHSSSHHMQYVRIVLQHDHVSSNDFKASNLGQHTVTHRSMTNVKFSNASLSKDIAPRSGYSAAMRAMEDRRLAPSLSRVASSTCPPLSKGRRSLRLKP